MGTSFHFLNVVWGKSFTELFLNYSLPTQLSTGNLRAIGSKGKNIYKLFTSTADAEVVSSSRVWQELSSVMQAEICELDSSLLQNINNDVDKYNVMTTAHRAGILAGLDDPSVAFVFLTADQIFADGALGAMRDRINEGRRAVMIIAPRLTQEEVLPKLVHYAQEDKASITLAPDLLVELALKHLHPITAGLFWDSPNYTMCPSNIYWTVHDEGFLARCFHLHPLAVKPVIRNDHNFYTVDDSYVMNTCPDFKSTYVVTDASEILSFTLCPIAEAHKTSLLPLREGVLMPNRANPAFVGEWIRTCTNPHHRAYSAYNIRLHTKERSHVWDEVETEANIIINECFKNYYLVKLYMDFPLQRLLHRAWSLCNPPFYWLYNKFEQCYARAFHEYSKLKVAIKRVYET